MIKNYLILLLVTVYIFAAAQPDINGIHMQMIFVKAGNFEMGNNNGKADAKPLHTVTLNDFYLGKYEVTQELWQQVMGIEKAKKIRLHAMSCL